MAAREMTTGSGSRLRHEGEVGGGSLPNFWSVGVKHHVLKTKESHGYGATDRIIRELHLSQESGGQISREGGANASQILKNIFQL